MPAPHGFTKNSAIRKSMTRLWLSTALLSVLGVPALAQQVVADGTDETAPSNTIIHTTAPYESGSGLWALNGGTIVAGGPISILTEGSQAYGIVAATGGNIGVTGAQIQTLGDYAYGITVSGTGSVITAANSSVQTDGYNALGAYAHMSELTLDNVDVTTNGVSSHGVSADYSGIVTMNGGTVTTNEINSYGLLATQTDALLTANGVKVTTNGDRAMGAAALQGGTLNLNDSDVITHGDSAHGLFVAYGDARATSINSSVKTTGSASHAIHATGNGAHVDVNGGSITTSGVAAHGALVTDNATLTIGRDPTSGSGTFIHTIGDQSRGVYTWGGGTVTIDGATIKTEGSGVGGSWSLGVQAVSGSTVSLTDTTIETSGNNASGINSEGAGTRVDMVRGSITTTGVIGGAAAAFTGGVVTLTDVTVSSNGRGVAAGDAGSRFDMTGGSITTTGSGADRSAAFAVRGATVNLTGADVRTEGDDARGLHAFNAGSTVNAVGSQVTTIGTGSHGAFASGSGSVNVSDSLIRTNGDIAHGLVAQNNSSVTATGSAVTTAGSGSAGVYLANGSTATLDSSVVLATDGPALQTASGNATFELKNGTQAISGNGTVLTAASGSSTTLTADGNVQLSGDMVAEADDAVIDATLSNKSQWYGAAKGVTSASVDGSSYWAMTGSSDVGALSNDGVVDFDAVNPYKTLTAGSLAMNGGSFILNTKLNEGGAASETDKIVVTGDATGNGLINIRNNGGTGAFTGTGTTDGIQVVEVGGASDAEFKLGSAAVIGIYDYQLKKADGQNWYLQTEGSDVVDPPACTPGVDCPGDGGDDGDGAGNRGPGTGHVVDIVPGYNIALSAAQNHVLTSLDTFHERLGELRAEELQDGYHAWMRGIGKTGSYSPKSITGYNGHGFDMTTAGVQIGADYSKSDVFVAGDKLTIGMFGEYANSSFNVRGRTADGSISSKGLGGYVTWQQKAPTERKPGTGAYVDAVVKQDWLEFGVNAKSVSGFDMQNGYKGKATTASIETGYGFDIGNNVVLQPQAQLTWSKVKADSFTDSYGIAVHGQEAESLIGRIGVRLEKTFYFGDEEERVEAAPVPAPKAQKQVKGKKGKAAKTVPAVLPDAPKKKFVKSVTTYADANVKHEFKGKNGLVASNTGIGNDMGGSHYDVGVGVVAHVSENVSLFGRGSVEFGGSTNVAGKVSGGLKITW